MDTIIPLLCKETLWGLPFYYFIPKESQQHTNDTDSAVIKTNLFGGNDDSGLQNNK